MSAPVELALDDYVLLLDGRVLEVLSRAGTSDRFHVDHVAVEAKRRRDGGLKVHVGIEAGGVLQQGVKLSVDAARESELMALLDEAKSRRTTGSVAG